jgi:uncharacterized membrane protein YedE/YeeE
VSVRRRAWRCWAPGYFIAGQLAQLWQFYLCIGLLGGLGASAIGMVPAAALISRWFDEPHEHRHRHDLRRLRLSARWCWCR